MVFVVDALIIIFFFVLLLFGGGGKGPGLTHKKDLKTKRASSTLFFLLSLTMSFARWVLIALLVAALWSTFAAAEVEPAEEEDVPKPASDKADEKDAEPADAAEPMEEAPGTDEDEAESKDPNQITGVRCHAFFTPIKDFPAGSPVESLITFDNSVENPSYEIVFIAAHLAHLGDANYYIQNFTGNTYSRVVAGGESATVKYRFQPDEQLDPRDYTLVVSVFFRTDENKTYLTAAFNDTATIVEPEGVDPKTIVTFVVIVAGVGLTGYYFISRRKKAFRPRKPTEEVGTNEADINFDYVSKEHVDYEKRVSSNSPKRPHSNSPKRPEPAAPKS